VPHPLPPALPRSGGPITRLVGRAGMRLLGWRLEGEFPNIPKMVLIVAPHTSNWDFIVGLAVKFRMGLHARWLGKHTIFRGPAGNLFRLLGGIAVDRSAAHNVVSESVRAFEDSERMILVITPEGTRKRVAEWKTGFWHIARGAGVPILPVTFDWGRKVVRIGDPIAPRESAHEQLPSIKAVFADATGRR
jgi:1-acyl-sn-glycerol-3-phosphate acyltransferase